MNTKSKYKSLLQNTLLFGISGFGTKFLSFFLVYIYTQELSTVEYGTVDVISTTVQLLIPLLTVNIQDAVLRFGMDKNCDPAEVLNIGLRLMCFGGVILGTSIIVLNWLSIFPISLNYWLFLFISFFSGGIFNVLSMYLKAKNEVKVLAIWGLLNTVITFCANVILLSIFHVGVNGYILATISGIMIANVGMFYAGDVMNDLKRSKYSKQLLLSMIAYSSPLIANSLGWWVNTASDRYILTFFAGAAINGVYAVSYKIPAILSAVQSVFYSAWSISAIKEFDKNDSDGFIGNVYSSYALASMLVASIIMILNLLIARILYSNEFFIAWKYVPVLLTGAVFNGLGLFIGCIFIADKKTKDVSLTTIFGALINTILNFVLIPTFGAIGAAAATMIGYFSIWLIRMIKLRNIIIMKVEWNVQIICTVLLLIQCLVASLYESFVYQLPICFFIVVCGRKALCLFIYKILAFVRMH